MTNHDIVTSFLKHEPAAGPISTNGKELMSYGVPIAKWVSEDEITMPDVSKFHSVTTSKHRNLVRRMAMDKGIKVTQVN